MGKVRLNEDRTVRADWRSNRSISVFVMNSKHRSRIRILRAIVIVSFIIKRNNCHR